MGQKPKKINKWNAEASGGFLEPGVFAQIELVSQTRLAQATQPEYHIGDGVFSGDGWMLVPFEMRFVMYPREPGTMEYVRHLTPGTILWLTLLNRREMHMAGS